MDIEAENNNLPIMKYSKKRGKKGKLLPAMICKELDSINLFVQTIERPVYVRTTRSKMAQNGTILAPEAPQTKYTAPKRYEATCYFMPLAVPVWYSTSVSLKINSTKRHYKESVNYQKKLVPYRFVETMTTETNRDAPPVVYVSEVNIDSQIPPKEHYMCLEAQQKAALSKPFSSNHQIQVESHS